MRIIGGSDFYDRGLSHGFDDKVTYRRTGLNPNQPYPPEDWDKVEPPALQEKWPFLEFVRDGRRHGRQDEFPTRDGRIVFSRLVVWLCGRRHGGLRADFSPDWNARVREPSSTFLWTMEATDRYLAEHGVTLEASRTHHVHGTTRRVVQSHFDLKEKRSVADWLARNGVAIAVHDGSREAFGWFLDCDVLKSVEFHRVLGPYETFQELATYVGGVLPGAGRPVVEITDQKVKIAKAGFDERSFRREPTKHARS